MLPDNDKKKEVILAAESGAIELSESISVGRVARQTQSKIAASLLNHWMGLTLFLNHPAVPMDNNLAENSLRTPVIGRKNFYGSASLWSAALAATMFTLFKTLDLWGIPARQWMQNYLQACAENGGQAPADVTPFLPWSLMESPRTRKPAALPNAAADGPLPDTS